MIRALTKEQQRRKFSSSRPQPRGQGVFRCAIGDEILPDTLADSHHKIPKRAGGSDNQINRADLCSRCHDAVHKIAYKLKAGKQSAADDIAKALFPNSSVKQQRLMDYAQKIYLAFLTAEQKPDDEVMLTLTMSRTDHERLRLAAWNQRNPQTGKKMAIDAAAMKIITDYLDRNLPTQRPPTNIFQPLPRN